MQYLMRRPILVVATTFLALGVLGCPPTGPDDQQGDDPVEVYGTILAEGTTYNLGYGEMAAGPEIGGLNQTVIELWTSEDDRNDMAGVTLYHASDVAPDGEYDVLTGIGLPQDGQCACNVITRDDRNYHFNSGPLSFTRTASGAEISIEGTTLCSTDGADYPVEVEWDGPLDAVK